MLGIHMEAQSCIEQQGSGAQGDQSLRSAKCSGSSTNTMPQESREKSLGQQEILRDLVEVTYTQAGLRRTCGIQQAEKEVGGQEQSLRPDGVMQMCSESRDPVQLSRKNGRAKTQKQEPAQARLQG